jgi:hypothetical protein
MPETLVRRFEGSRRVESNANPVLVPAIYKFCGRVIRVSDFDKLSRARDAATLASRLEDYGG